MSKEAAAAIAGAGKTRWHRNPAFRRSSASGRMNTAGDNDFASEDGVSCAWGGFYFMYLDFFYTNTLYLDPCKFNGLGRQQ